MHYNQIYSSNDCISSKMCILVLTDMMQCWMYNFMVLTAARTSSSALILRNHSESRPGPLRFSHRSLMLDYPLTQYFLYSSTQYDHNVKDNVLSCLSDICELTVTDYLTTSQPTTFKLRGTGSGFVCYVSNRQWNIIVLVFMVQTLNSSLMITACDETAFHSEVHFWVQHFKGEFCWKETFQVSFSKSGCRLKISNLSKFLS